MTGLLIGGSRHPVPGVSVVTWLDDPVRAPPITDGRVRLQRPSAIVLHTSRGAMGAVRAGARPSNRAELLARYQSRTVREVSWHLTVDTDGDVIQQADCVSWTCWHAGTANPWTVGIELVQHEDTPDLWQIQIDAAVRVVDTLCGALAIPRRIPVDDAGAPLRAVVAWPTPRWPGVIGHRHLTTQRGPGDPGDAIFLALLSAGFAGVALRPL